MLSDDLYYNPVTFIGYGNIAPATASGKVATIVYGLIGIPLTLYLLSVIGKFLTVSLKLWVRQISSSQSSAGAADEFDFGPAIILVLLAIFFGAGAALFGYLEEWDWLDAGYFSFITFSTIGLGDIVPENLEAAILAMVFTFTALSLFSLIFNVFQQVAEVYIERLYAYFGNKYQASDSSGGKIGKDTKSKNGSGKTESDSGFTRIPHFQTSTPVSSPPKNSYESSKSSWNKAAAEEEVEEAEVEEDQT